VHTVNELGHLLSFAPEGTPELHHSLPSEMLQLATTDRPHLVAADSAAAAPELWLADDRKGAVHVWRAELSRALSGSEWNWEPLFEDDDLGQLRGFAVGHGGRDPRNLQPGGAAGADLPRLPPAGSNRAVAPRVPGVVVARRQPGPPR
jgi:hypothetical protein